MPLVKPHHLCYLPIIKSTGLPRRNSMYQTILFDLDGTLTDPGIGITNSVQYALKRYGIAVNDRTELYKFIGPPLIESFMCFYGFSREKAKEAVGVYREYYGEKGIFENRVYEGIPELLEGLKEAGCRLLVATSKPEFFAEKILRHYDLEKYFLFTAGSTMEKTRTRKSEVIRYALTSCGIKADDAVVMVGDREHDIIGAKEAGLSSIGVLFGYGTREELEQAGADHIAADTKEIRAIITDGVKLTE